MNCVLGFDGGGTKTDCVALSETGVLLARGRGPASNPTRIGFPAAISAVAVAADSTLRSIAPAAKIVAICAALAGAGQSQNRDQLASLLSAQFPSSIVDVRTDLDLALSALPLGPGIALVIGTGSAAIGRDAAGNIKREGGWGPAGSDEGSAFDVGKTATLACRNDISPAASELSRQIFRHLGAKSWYEVDARSAIASDSVYPKVFPVVAAAADAGNVLAQSILRNAARQLAELADRLAPALGLSEMKFPIGKTGGTVGRSRFLDATLDAEIKSRLPNASIMILEFDPAETAARIALRLLPEREGGKN
jgi:N-acetylglucosamine kinase-like BadF-type ATPase